MNIHEGVKQSGLHLLRMFARFNPRLWVLIKFPHKSCNETFPALNLHDVVSEERA